MYRPMLLRRAPAPGLAWIATCSVQNPFAAAARLLSLMSLMSRIFAALGMPRAALAVLRRQERMVPQDVPAMLRFLARANLGRDLPLLLVCCDLLSPKEPRQRAAIGDLARRLMDEGRAAEAMRFYARLDRPAAVAPTKLYESAYMDPARVLRGEPYVHDFSEVIVETDHCAIFDGDKIYWRESSGRNIASHPYVNGRTSRDLKFVAACRPEPTATLDEPFVLLGTDGGSNYSHWLSRNVLKLALLEPAGIASSMPILINEDLSGFQREFIDLLQIPMSRLMPVKRGVVLRCRQVFVPVNLRLHPAMSVGMAWLRARLAHLMTPPQQACDLLFISRRDSSHRVLLNEMEIEAALAALGFRTVVLGEMTVAEQIHAFSRARVIVGAHGAGLTNLMFAPANAVVVEITNTKICHMGDFRSIAEQLGQRYIEVVSGHYPQRQRPEIAELVQRHDYLVHVDDVREAVREALAGHAQPGA